MNLYLVTDPDAGGYDVFHGFVVACKDELTARYTDPGERYTWSGDRWDSGSPVRTGHSVWTDHPYRLDVKLIGTTDLHKETTIIITDFNAG